MRPYIKTRAKDVAYVIVACFAVVLSIWLACLPWLFFKGSIDRLDDKIHVLTEEIRNNLM